MTPRNKTIILWLVFLLGLLVHTDLRLMPLFHGLSVTASHAQSMADIAPVMWLLLGFFVPPIAAIIATSFPNSQSYRTFHFGFTILYTVLNFAHLISDLMVQPIIWYQIALMAILLAIGLLLNWVSFQWLKA